MQKLEKIAYEYNLSPGQISNLDKEGSLYLHKRQEKYLQGINELRAFMTYEDDFSYITLVAGSKLEEHLKSLEDIRTGPEFYESWHEQGIVSIPNPLMEQKNIKGLAAVEGYQDTLLVYNLDEYAKHLEKIKKKGFDDLSFLPQEIKIS